ncbi:hypothetical protein D1869_08710 [Sulfurisphaera ohwakuensis]|uniref:Uncharacterized protein n=1 Tax=Sulfurisphaera ohwakuensis TaxID=69656 RepID=A0A650CHK5_SULOH|nr:hypothetical protein [Sulfurisphaera ohwakuensis]MBB5255068.1 hypothetical protein [Sulfurisphaera ohwakuensis]QGR17263.1 hypothetical protein D1869_08710 [Sulfurisphaera ohwakuensis]
MRKITISFLMSYDKFILMRIVEDKNGERFLELESEEDIDEFFNAVIKRAKEKANARKSSYESQSPK